MPRPVLNILLSFLFCCVHFTSFTQVVINEYSCSNLSSFVDNFGNYEDWIELYNTSASPVNLSGYSLSDKKTKPAKWKFGNVTIAANGFLRVWASGANQTTGTNLHTNFKLTQCKPDMILFSDASGTILDSLTLKRTQLSHSRGRIPNGGGAWAVFQSPTPGASNINAYQEYAAKPIMSIAAGFYSAAQSVTITSPDPNTTVHYTTDGSTPTSASTLYSGTISVGATTVIRARAFSSVPTIPASFVESNTYFINSTHTTEVISIFGDQVASLLNGNQSFPPTGIEYFDATGAFKSESFGQTNKHGNDSWSYPQRGIDFVSMDEYGYDYALHHQLFNSKTRKDFQRIILKASANDNYPFECPKAGNPNAWGDPNLFDACHIRDAYVHTVSQKAHLFMDERTWAPSILYVNGQYWGVYDLREKVDDADFTNYYYNTGSDSLQYLQTWGATWSAYGGTQAQTDWTNLANFIKGNNMAIPANYKIADSLLNVKSLADYIILNSYCVTSDWLNWNTAWWRGINVNGQKKKWRYTLWDEDATFHHYINYTGIPNNNANADPCDPSSLIDPGGQGQIPILNALLQNPGFKQYYILRYFDLVNTGLSCKRMTDILDSMILVITPEMPKQIAKWGGNMSAWQQNVSDLRNFILARCDSVIHKFDSCYQTTGPFPLKVNVVPAGAGTVDVNSLHLTQFVWSGNYPGNIQIGFNAHPNAGYCFDHWGFQHHTPSPNTTDTAVSVSLTMTDSVVAYFNMGATPSVTATQPSICVGDSTKLQASSGTGYTWTPTVGLSCTTCANPTATPTTTTTYSVVVVSNCGTGSTNITISVSQPPVPSVSGNATICNAESTNLTASGGSTYAWAPPTGLSCSNCPNPVATPASTTTYTLVVSNGAANCFGIDTVTVVVKGECPEIYVPTGFSPNGDNNNEMLFVFGDMTDLHFVIYNRWGNVVFETTDKSMGWDGTQNGKPVQSGVYAYKFSATDSKGNAVVKSGNISVIR